jgi:NitT/TauT family transport system substrate-binding protein
VLKIFRLLLLAAFAVGLAALPAAAQQARDPQVKPEKPDLKLSVGGKSLLYYLPLTITERLGYFKDEGLDVEISDFPGGAKSLQALIGGSVDVTVGSFEHTIQMQAKRQPLVAVTLLGRYPGIALGVLASKADRYTGPQDLKGMKIGVTAPGSSTNFMLNYLLMRNGLAPDAASFIGVGAGASAVAAVRRGEIDAICNLDPVISQLESQKAIRVVIDTRTAEGTTAVYGGSYPAATLYLPPDFARKNPNTTQALVNALVRGLKWIGKATPEQIAAAMPAEYALGDPANYVESIAHSRAMWSPDGSFPADGAENVYKVLSAFDPAIRDAPVDLAATHDERFVAKALEKYGN